MPRYLSGEVDPLWTFTSKHLYAPLIISIRQELPPDNLHTLAEDLEVPLLPSTHEELLPVADCQTSTEDHESCNADDSNCDGSETSSEQKDDSHSSSQECSEGSVESRLTVSAWLDLVMYRPAEDPEEDDEPEAIGPLLNEFDAHFLSVASDSRSAPSPPSTCEFPVLMMASHDELPVLMSSLLYQRHVWHIDTPLVSIGFSRSSTIIKLFVGWLDEQVVPGNALVCSLGRSDDRPC